LIVVVGVCGAVGAGLCAEPVVKQKRTTRQTTTSLDIADLGKR
jgi:hypothetical protein